MRRLWACRALSVDLVTLALPAAPALSAEVPRLERPADASQAGTPLAVILERAGAYVLRYGESFRNLTAEEAYRQTHLASASVGESSGGLRIRNMRSDVVVVRLRGLIPWCTFRDVFLVDGSKVQDRTGRLERLLTHPSDDAREQASTILAESARYNLGGVYRNVNAPTVALLFLLPGNQKRLVFESKARKTIDGFQTTEVGFRERLRPTLVNNSRGGDVPASGSFWIDPLRGTVLRTEIQYHVVEDDETPSDRAPVIGVVQTRYRREPGLDIFVPDTMKERYWTPGGGLIDGKARYTKYRRFQVTSDWEVVGTEKPPLGKVPSPP